MYIIKDEVVEYDKIETNPGYKCLLEDISEDGAMIRIGGVGKNNVPIKIQFELNGALIVMFGVIRAVEFNESLNQSRLHFECTHIEQGMKNSILSYVYNVIPQDQKDINEAIAQAEAFENEESVPEIVNQPIEAPDYNSDSIVPKKYEPAETPIPQQTISSANRTAAINDAVNKQ